MTYSKTNWKDRIVEKPRTYKIQNNQDGTITLIPMEGNIIEEGTPLNSANMNHIEEGIVNLENSKSDKSVYGDGGVIRSQSVRVANTETASTLFRLYHDNTKHTFQITQSGGFANIQCGGKGTDEGGVVTISGLNGKDLSNLVIKTPILNNADWSIYRDTLSQSVIFRNMSTKKALLLKDDGKVSYGGGSIPVINQPAFEQSVSLGTNKVVTVTHNLGYKPLVEVGMTLGNVNVTWQHLDNNNIRLYNYSAGNEATAYIRCW